MVTNKRKRASTLGMLASEEEDDSDDTGKRRPSKRKNYAEDSDEDEQEEDEDNNDDGYESSPTRSAHNDAGNDNENRKRTLTNGELDDDEVDSFKVSLKIGHNTAQIIEQQSSSFTNGHHRNEESEDDDENEIMTTARKTSRKSVRINGPTVNDTELVDKEREDEGFNEFVGDEEENKDSNIIRDDEDDDEDDEVIRPYPRSLRRSLRRSEPSPSPKKEEKPSRRSLRRKNEEEEKHTDSDEYKEESDAIDVELSELENEKMSVRGFIDDSDDEMAVKTRRRGRTKKRGRGRPRSSTNDKSQIIKQKRNAAQSSEYEDSDQGGEVDEEEENGLREELRDLRGSVSPPSDRKHQLRARKEVNYQIPPPPTGNEDYSTLLPQDSSAPKQPPAKRGGRNNNNGPTRRLFPTTGPFGGSGVVSIFGHLAGPPTNSSSSEPSVANTTSASTTNNNPTTNNNSNNNNATAYDSDSSDDENGKAKLIDANGPAGGKQKKSGLADTDPLGVDMNIDFDAVGGLDTYIYQLKEMVSLPLRYPEVYQQFNVTPPRGVLFHGPPGTGKTLMARALAASCSTDGRKITFFMRKGADCLSKWVGEAERQLRVLFEEARNQQPSIIFFDEIDGLAPVRSSKQEQIHASIVSTLLALMDGMDNRGQVIVIGATNRPDSVDPALRRPGRFDREFYFPLPDLESRKKIISIHTKKWDPPLKDNFVEKIAGLTKGYGGADLRALCTEAALNAIQRRYPQIYMSDKRLLVDPQSIHVVAADFMKSIERIVPSSSRSTSSGAEPLPPRIEPLLRDIFDQVKGKLDHFFPKRKKLSSLEEAMYEQLDEGGFEKHEAVKGFKMARLFRPRLLIYGEPGMGQHYIGSAILHYLEGFHIQTFDIGTLLSDSARTPETAVVQMLTEVRRHTPSVIFIPNIEVWFETISDYVKSALMSFLRNLGSSEEILFLGIAESDYSEIDPQLKAMFGFSGDNYQQLLKPTTHCLTEFFKQLIDYLKSKPTDYPDMDNRPKRKLEALEVAPPPEEKPLTKNELKERELKDKKLKNSLKVKLGPLMDIFKNRYKRFKKPPIDDALLIHLFEPPLEVVQHEYVKADDDMILEVATGKKYYNIDLDIIEERLWNGFYSEPKQFLRDIEMINIDAQTHGDRDRLVKASEMYANAQVAIEEIGDAQFLQQCHELRKRELAKIKELEEERIKLEHQQKESEQQQNSSLNGGEVHNLIENENNDITTGYEGESSGHNTANGNATANNGVYSDDTVVNSTTDHHNDTDGDIVMDENTTVQPRSKEDEPQITNPEEKTNGTATPLDNSSHEDNATGAEQNNGSVGKETVPEEKPKEYFVPPSPSPGPEPEDPNKEITLGFEKLEAFQERLVQSAKSFTIEQLEQLNSALVDTLWSQRHIWDRNQIIDSLEDTLTQVVDIIVAANKKASLEAAHLASAM